MGENIENDNVQSLLDLADQFSCNVLRKLCGEFLSGSFETLGKEGRLLSLSEDTIYEIISNDNLEVNQERVIVQ